ncbi:hypothetical protein MMC28_000066 [Mycoblastus sanguinarius]|nr:hypothetical protein [Mycoblastus sanguinarius]
MLPPVHPIVLGTLVLLFSVANISTCYLYLYPIIHGCAFPSQPVAGTEHSDFPSYQSAPFRLLVLGDPQLEGDSSISNPEESSLPNFHTVWSDLRAGNLRGLSTNLPRILQSYRKRLDLIGNDYYLAHIYRSLQWSVSPTHVAVLGDLIGSQWVSDEEFERRGIRYWQRVFLNGRRVEDELTNGVHIEPLEQDESWNSRIISVAGNHDVGYAGDMTPDKMQRFERVYGKANWETRFNLPSDSLEEGENPPELRLVVLNSLNLDAPAYDSDLQSETYNFVNDIIAASRPVEDPTTLTILLSHLPLHKEAGVCVDGPYFNFHEEQHGGGVKEQNHLSYDASRNILEGIYGMSGNAEAPREGFGRNGLILTGHDHEGCDVYHYLPETDDATSRSWTAAKRNTSSSYEDDEPVPSPYESVPNIREITVRSMMGDFGGNAGLLSVWFDAEVLKWKFEYSTCSLGTQHIWWAIHILDIITIVLLNIVGWTLFWKIGDGKRAGTVKEKTL